MRKIRTGEHLVGHACDESSSGLQSKYLALDISFSFFRANKRFHIAFEWTHQYGATRTNEFGSHWPRFYCPQNRIAGIHLWATNNRVVSPRHIQHIFLPPNERLINNNVAMINSAATDNYAVANEIKKT